MNETIFSAHGSSRAAAHRCCVDLGLFSPRCVREWVRCRQRYLLVPFDPLLCHKKRAILTSGLLLIIAVVVVPLVRSIVAPQSQR